MAKEAAPPLIFHWLHEYSGQSRHLIRKDGRFEQGGTTMSDVHLKDVKDDLTHEPAWVYLYGLIFVGIVVFALLMGGFMG